MLKKRSVRLLVVACVAAAAGLFTTGVAASPAYASSGTVECATSAVVGMWVNVSGGSSGWATLTSTSDPTIKHWSYNTGGKSWDANVGCGGTPQNWANPVHLPYTTMTSGTIICRDTGYMDGCTIH